MVRTGKSGNIRRGAWFLFILFVLVLACLVFAAAAESRVSNGRFVATDWVRRYKGSNEDLIATAIALDGQGNIYVTGSPVAFYNYSADIVTIKYSPDGRQLWTRRYSNPENYSSFATALAVDSQGNVCITGYTVMVWSRYGDKSFSITFKYDPDGQLLWERQYADGPQSGATALAVDCQGNFYVTGTAGSLSGATGLDYATIKYSPDGQELWVRHYNGPGNGFDYPWAIAADAQGNVLVTGYSLGSGTSYDYATVKYNSGGDEMWVRRYNGPRNSEDGATAITVDGYGNAYVTGWSWGLETEIDYATIKYNPEGEELWVRRYNGPGNAEDQANAIAVDAQGNVYVTGHSTGSGTDHDFATVKYSPAGKQLWVRRYNGPGNGWDEARAMATDDQGNVYVTGWSWGSGDHSESATIKYGPDGRRLWLRRYTGDGENGAWAMATDAQANVLITGYTVIAGKVYGYLTIKYTQTP